MPATNAWDETKPADSDLANTLGAQGRQTKLDVRERSNLQHVWGVNQTDDGGHRNISIAATYMAANTEALAATGFSLTGANAQSLIDLSGTWNTTGQPVGIKLNIVDTASNANSQLMALQVGGASKFVVDKSGNVTCSGNVVANGVTLGGSAYANGFGSLVQIANNSTGNVGPTLALTDLLVFGYLNLNTAVSPVGECALTCKTDSSNPPITAVQQIFAPPVNNVTFNWSFCFPVKKGNYYSVTLTNSSNAPAQWFGWTTAIS